MEDEPRVTISWGVESVELSHDEVDLLRSRLGDYPLSVALAGRLSHSKRTGEPFTITEPRDRDDLIDIVNWIEGGDRPQDMTVGLWRLREMLGKTPPPR
jgi:hypothetical protein